MVCTGNARHFKFLKEQQIVVPGQHTAQSFSVVVSPIKHQIRCLRDRNRNLRQTRDLFLPKLISGEIDVSKLDVETEGSRP